jgi:hypothetical protein
MEYTIHTITFKKNKYYLWELPYSDGNGGGYLEFLVAKDWVVEGEQLMYD